MKKDLCDQLHLDYPHLYATKVHIECGDGWFFLIDTLSRHLEDHILRLDPGLQEQIYADQVKEKYASLRFYLSHSTPVMEGVIALVEDMSAHTCEHCGHPGRQRKGGWIRTLCDACHTEE